MKHFIILITIAISLNFYAKFADAKKDEVNSKEYELAFFGALGRLITKGVKNIDELSPNSMGDDIIKLPSKNSNKFGNFQKQGTIKSSLVKNTDSFNWGYNPSFLAMSRGVREIYENDRESYNEMATWKCPPHIKNKNLENFSTVEDRCVAYQMSCNAKVFEQNTNNELSSLGSGFFVNPNILVTNNHVVRDLGKNIIKIKPFTLEHEIEAEVYAYSKKHDLAVLQFNKNYYFPSCEINKFLNPIINSNVVAIGSPGDREFDLTKGIIEKYLTKDFIFYECLQTKIEKPIQCFLILNQDDGEVVGSGKTYREAEDIAKKLINSKGGRYRIGSVSHFNDTYWIQMNAFITYGSSGGPLYHQRKVIGVNTLKYNEKNMSLHFSKIINFLNISGIKNYGYYYYKDNRTHLIDLISKN